MASGPRYSGVYTGVEALHSGARKREETGQALVDAGAKFREALNQYKTQYKRSGSVALGTVGTKTVLDGLATKVFDAYIKLKKAEKVHGQSIVNAPPSNEYSQAVENVNEPSFFGLFTTTKSYSTSMTATISEEREINAIVRDHPEQASKFGLTESGAGAGPNLPVLGGVRTVHRNRRNRRTVRRNRRNRRTVRRNRRTVRRNRRTVRRNHHI
jgi:hypothetical protein